ncbi:hypothetical protein KGY64_06000 [Candidatus Bipolaricaulota bacterium]|nr:hypothetical protein [Candidatus Bipolaricaulota bacterium]
MSKTEQLLSMLERGGSLDGIASSLGMRKQTVRAMIETLEHQGKVKKVSSGSACNSCPMSGSCPGASSGREKTYVVVQGEDEREKWANSEC